MPKFEDRERSDPAKPAEPDQNKLREESELTREKVAAEHWAAYDSLSPAQFEVFRRMREVENAGNFSNKSWEERFHEACANEARSRRARSRHDLGLPPEE